MWTLDYNRICLCVILTFILGLLIGLSLRTEPAVRYVDAPRKDSTQMATDSAVITLKVPVQFLLEKESK